MEKIKDLCLYLLVIFHNKALATCTFGYAHSNYLRERVLRNVVSPLSFPPTDIGQASASWQQWHLATLLDAPAIIQRLAGFFRHADAREEFLVLSRERGNLCDYHRYAGQRIRTDTK